MKYFIALVASLALFGCDHQPTTDEKMNAAQENILAQGNSAVGMPAIDNFFEKKLLKQIYELRDQANFVTYCYTLDMSGKKHFQGQGIGYGIPATTEYTSPSKLAYSAEYTAVNVVANADPNGLFSGDTHGTWYLMKDPHSNDTKPVYFECDIIVSPFKLDAE